MTTERRKEDFIDSETQNLTRSTKSKKKYKSKKTNPFSFEKLTFELKTKPKKTVQKFAVKFGLYCWTFAVVISVLSLLGFPVSSVLSSATFQDPDFDYHASADNSRVLRASDAAEETSKESFWASFSSNIFPSNSLLAEFQGDDSDADEDLDEEFEESPQKQTSETEDETIPEQIVPLAPKQGNKLNRKLEKELACQEVDCSQACVEKMKPKCSRSASCRRERERLCKKRCRKQRCEERCKDEPKFGYVEREQRMEKCKDDCSGPTAVHNKCIKKCHSQFKPCKSRCHEIASKYVCDKEPELDIFTNSNEDEGGEEDPEQESEQDEEEDVTLSLFDDPEAI